MSSRPDPSFPIHRRRCARRMAYLNGTIWALGAGLTSNMLIVYLAMEYEVAGFGLGIGLILAAPRFAGLLRLVAPALIGRLSNRKRFCLGSYLLSTIVLFGLPVLSAPGVLPSPGASLGALILLWCVYHLLEYLGTVALWSWMADLVPLRIRGRFLGRRERWLVAGQAVGMIAAGLFSYVWHDAYPNTELRWLGYAIPGAAGACFMMGSLVPLARIPRLAASPAGRGASLGSMLAPFRDPRFLRLLLFGCWFSFSNGVTQLTQAVYPWRVLGIGMFFMLGAKTWMRAGQLAVSPWMGKLADRVGNRPVMLAALPVVALGPLGYFLSSLEQPDWQARLCVAAAWSVWIAYAGLNVCLPNLILKLSPGESNTPYIATYYAITGLCLAVSTVFFGTLYDLFGRLPVSLFGDSLIIHYYRFNLLGGWILRTLGILFLLFVLEAPRRAVRTKGVPTP